ncbi:amidase signature domain-containing protein [Apiosordaria backusii]|uniref:Amidase signature domain-containing protein n=1 Tax=Apiosordaria backusii TaxID=314023 RepID=A0AA40EYJ5_9PEZI|nr:amidase signature domain-containing protein [Apiosordaria backusii]
MSTRDKDQSPPLDKPLERQIITTVGEVQYLVHPQKLGHVSSTGSPSELQDIVPVTGLTVEQFNSPSFFQIIEDFNRLDDVYMYGFNKRIVIIDQSEAKLAADDKTHEIPPHRIHGLFLDVERHLVMPGPYFIYNGGLHQAWRLYPDKLRAFNFGIVPRALHDPQNCAYNLVSALSLDGLHKAIAVPSRLYSGSLSHEKPLSGIRFVVDDLVSMKGVKTTLSHETWTALYPPCQSTSYLIKKLIGWGAVMVGKTKASQFACLHTAWVDASSPKNPRADGYQEALGSAPGAGSALAGYKWVDCAVGVDTLGGFLETAEWYGLFALRLTHNWQYISEMNLASPRLAAVAIMSRSLERVRQVMKSIALQIPQPPRPLPPTPNTIIYFKDLFDEEERRNQKRLAAPFISLFEVELQGGRLDIDLSKRWEQRQPSEANAPGEALDMFMRNCAFQVYCHEFGRKYNRFIQDYNTDEEAIECVEPYWDDAVAYIW